MRYQEEILCYESGEAQKQVAQRTFRCPIPENVQGQEGELQAV